VLHQISVIERAAKSVSKGFDSPVRAREVARLAVCGAVLGWPPIVYNRLHLPMLALENAVSIISVTVRCLVIGSAGCTVPT
jgi:hypothetical protein